MNLLRILGALALLAILAVPSASLAVAAPHAPGLPQGTTSLGFDSPAALTSPTTSVHPTAPPGNVPVVPMSHPSIAATASTSIQSGAQLTAAAEKLIPATVPHNSENEPATVASPSPIPQATTLHGEASPAPAEVASPASTTSTGVWTLGCQDCAPAARSGEMMAYDPAAGYVLMFGGQSFSQTFLADTWTYKAGVWTELQISAPPARAYGAMAWDAADNEIVLFGGMTSTTPTLAGDTWTFSSGAWHQDTSSTNNPSARDDSYLTYDTTDGYLFLWGGLTGSGYQTDSWKFSGTQWTDLDISAADAPPYLIGAMAYDAFDGYVLLFGYTTGTSSESETWDYNGGSWTDIGWALSSQPPDDAPPVMVYDTNDQQIILEEWATSGEVTWFFHGGLWDDVTSTAGGPSASTWDAMAYDQADQQAVYLVVPNNEDYLDTWAYPGAPSVSVSANLPGVDVNEQVEFTATTSGGVPPFSYSWTGLPQGCSNINENPLTCTPTGTKAADVVVSVTDSGSRQAQSSALPFTVSPAPTIAAPKGSVPSADTNEPITFSTSVTGGPQTYEVYSWPHLPSGCNSANTSTLPCTPSSPGTYTVQVDVTDGNRDPLTSPAISFVVLSNPGVTLAVKPTLVDVGQNVTFWANATGGSGVYTTSYNNLPSGCHSANVSVLTCPPSTSSSTVTASVVDTLGGTATSSPVAFAVDSDPTLSASFTQGSASAYANETLTLQLSYGSGSPNYHPCLNATGSSLGGIVCGIWQGGSSYSFGFWYTQAGSYTVTASIEDSTDWNTTVPLTVNVYWPLFGTGVSLPTTLDQGMTANGTVNIHHGIPGYSVWWNDTTSGSPLCASTPASDGSSTCPFVPMWTGTDTIEVTVRDSGWGSAFANLSLLVNAAPSGLTLSASVGTFSCTAGGTLEDEVGANVAFSASYTGGTLPYTTTWSYNGSVVMGSGNSLTYTWTHTSTYVVTFVATDNLGRHVSGSITVVVYPSASGLALNAPLTKLDVGTSENLTLNFSGGLSPFSYTWNMGDGTVSTTAHPWFVHAWASAGTFTVSVTITDAAGGQISTTVTVTVQPDPTVANATAKAGGSTSSAGGTLEPLVNQTVQFSAYFTGGLGPYHYSWSANSTVIGSGAGNGPWFNLSYVWKGTGSFTVMFQVTDVEGHTSSASLTILVKPDLFNSLVLTSSWAQPDSGVADTFTISFQGGVGPFSYAWTLGDGTGTFTSVPELVHTFATAGTFKIEVAITDSLGGSGTAILDVTVVSPLSVPCAATVNATTVWAGDPLTLSLGCVSGGTQPYTYDWDFGDGGRSTVGSTVSYAFGTAGNYSVVVLVNDTGGSSVYSTPLAVTVLSLGEVVPQIQSATYRLNWTITTGGTKDLKLLLSVKGVSDVGTLTGVRVAATFAALATANWQPLSGAYIWVNVTATNDTPILYIQVLNSLNRTSALYTLATSFTSLFPIHGPGGGGGVAGLSLGEMFLIAVGVGAVVLVAVILLLMLARRKRGKGLTESSGGDGPADPVTASLQDHVAKNPGIDRESLVSAVASATKTPSDQVDTKVIFLVNTHQLVETECDDGRKTYTQPDLSATHPAPVQESLELGQKRQLIEDELAKRGDLIPLDELVPFGETLGLDKTKLATLIGDNSGVTGAFAVEADPAQPGSLLVSLTPAKRAALKLPPITNEPVIVPSLPANEELVDSTFPENRVTVQIDSESRGEP